VAAALLAPCCGMWQQRVARRCSIASQASDCHQQQGSKGGSDYSQSGRQHGEKIRIREGGQVASFCELLLLQ